MNSHFRLYVLAVTLVMWAISHSPATWAQQSHLSVPPNPALPPNPESGATLALGNKRLTAFFDTHTPYEFWLTCIIATFGLSMILILIISMRKIAVRPEDISRPIVVVTLIVAALFLITAGYSNEQIAPAFGLFGTIVGYILGRLSHNEPQPGDANENRPSTANGTTNSDTQRAQPRYVWAFRSWSGVFVLS